MRHARETQPLTALAGALLGASLVLGPMLASQSRPSESNGGCVVGSELASVNPTLTPWLLVNSPYNGSGSGSVYVDNGSYSLTLSPLNGAVVGFFEHFNWSVSSEVSPPGSSVSCAGKFFLSYSDDWTSTTYDPANGAISNFTNDSDEPSTASTSWTAATIHYYNGFYRPTASLSTCGSGAAVKRVRSNHSTIGVSFNQSALPSVINVTLSVETWYSYTFPANGGTWLIDNLSAPGGPGGGWSFSYSPCA